MNNTIIFGRLTKDPEVRYSQGENPMAIASFSVAVDRQQKNGEQSADFIPCKAFGKTAENLGKYFQKGARIVIQGHLQSGSYKNQEGRTIYTLDLVVDRFDFVERKSDTQGQAPQQAYQQPPQQAPQAPAPPAYQQPPQQAPQNAGFVPVDDEEGLPFR